MRHTRHYTLDQARAARGWVARRVGWMRGARSDLQALGSRAIDGIGVLDPSVGGSYPGPEIARPLVALSRALSELESMEVVLRDIERGLVDFPALLEHDGRKDEIYLCWLVDEDEIRFWHPLDAGFAGRRPL